MRRLSLRVSGPLVPLSVLDSGMRTVAGGVGSVSAAIDEAHHLLSAHLPSGRTVRYVLPAGDEDAEVLLDGGPIAPTAIGSSAVAIGLVFPDGPPVDDTPVRPERLVNGVISLPSFGVRAQIEVRRRAPSPVGHGADQDAPALIDLPALHRTGVVVAFRATPDGFTASALPDDDVLSVPLSFLAAGNPRQARRTLEERDVDAVRRRHQDDPIGCALIAALTAAEATPRDRTWLVAASERHPDNPDLAVAAADAAFRFGADGDAEQHLRRLTPRRLPILTTHLLRGVHLLRRTGREVDFILPSAAVRRTWFSAAAVSDPTTLTLFRRGLVRHTAATPLTVARLPLELPETWEPSRTTAVRTCLAELRDVEPRLDQAIAELLLRPGDMYDFRRGVDRFLDFMIQEPRLGAQTRTTRLLVDRTLAEIEQAFSLAALSVRRARRSLSEGTAQPADGFSIAPDFRRTATTPDRDTDMSVPIGAQDVHVVRDGGFTLVIRFASTFTTTVEMQVTPSASCGYPAEMLVPIRITEGRVTTHHWVAVSATGQDVRRGSVTVPVRPAPLRITIAGPPLSVREATTIDRDAVLDAFRCADRAGRDIWRRVDKLRGSR